MGEVEHALADLLRAVLTAAMQRAERVAREREAAHRDAENASREQAREAEQRLREERDAARPLLRQAWDNRWWQQTRKEPGRLGPVWQAATEWAAAGDPYASTTLEHLRREIAARFGIEPPAPGLGGTELLAALTPPAITPSPEIVAPEGQSPAVPEPGWYEVVLRHGPREIRRIHALDHGTSPELLAARHLRAYGEDHVLEGARAEIHASDEHGRRGELRVVVPGEHTEEILRRDEERLAAEKESRRALIADADPAAGPEYVRALREEAREVRVRAAFLATVHDVRDVDLVTVSGIALHAKATTYAELAGELHARADDLETRARGHEALLRGEDPRAAERAALLREALDEGWWRTAGAAEVGGVWDHVRHWPPGLDRDAMRDELRRRIVAHFGVEVAPDAAAVHLAERLRVRAVPEAEEAYRCGAHAHTQARLVEARLRAEPRRDAVAVLRAQADGLLAEARTHAERARAAVYGGPEANPAQIAQLRDAYAAAWGRELTDGEVGDLARLATEGFPAPDTAPASGHTADLASETFAQAVERGRASLSAMADREAAGAATLAGGMFAGPAREATRPRRSAGPVAKGGRGKGRGRGGATRRREERDR